MEIIYTVSVPYGKNATIEVYGEPDMGWYEWRIRETGHIKRDTGAAGGQQYGQAEIALRDALMSCTGLLP